jgi:outer membrane protein assembly factor BamB
VYVSERGHELGRRRQRRLRAFLFSAIIVVIAAAVLVAGGWAQDLWSGLTGEKAAGGPATSGDASPGPPTSAVLITQAPRGVAVDPPPPIEASGDGVKVSTYLGDETRRVYGLGPAPAKLRLIWKTFIGGGLTSPVGKGKNEPWSGSGWTGQPVIVRDKGKLYLLWGAFDRKLHKIEVKSGKIVWEYSFDDIIKSSPTVIEDPSPKEATDKYIVMAGSRRGWPSGFTDSDLAPYRAVSVGSGKELWRLPVPLTSSYSRDVDGSGFFYKGRMYSGVESGWFYKFDPFKTESWNGHRKPKIIAERLLLGDSSAASHGGNLVLEASPALLDDIVYVASGAGHVYGMRRSDLKVVWDYKTGSDMDGTTVTTSNGKLLVAVEKQYIGGHGGILMLDPSRKPSDSVVWFFPTGDRDLGDWEGGVIGSVAVNDAYDPWGRRPRLAAFMAIDGNLYVVSQNKTSGSAPGPNGDGPYPTPRLIAKFPVGGSISTPIMVDDTIVAAGYDNAVHLYKIKYTPAEKGDAGALKSPNGNWFTVSVKEKDRFSAAGAFESTPVMWKGRIFIGCRDGSLYCIGDE